MSSFMEDSSHSLIAACLARHGRQGFVEPFLTLARQAGADQVMIFSYTDDHAACLLSRNFVEGVRGDHLAQQYLEGWFRDDPLCAHALALPAGAFELFNLAQLRNEIPAEYHQRFFVAPGLGDKRAAVIAGPTLRLAVNLYRRDDGPAQPDLLNLLAQLAILHFEAAGQTEIPQALSVLSERESQVCLGILQGKKAEIIAHELGLQPTSVVTYRRRAYDKLGISSRASLFAICRP
ncbi:LuxR C-terminal-related transcriptional regulator [Actibacterium sp.]|uniref:helix-turn-helix transcriptional regulator n=1 Tax=Actibacterium sp. TaxID=1872125 RepID=UPI003568C2A8